MCVNVDKYRTLSINFTVFGASWTQDSVSCSILFYFTNLGTQCCINQYAEIQTSVTQNLLEA